MASAAGYVYFIGAGPGDPELLTLKGRRILGEADVVIYADALVDPRLGQFTKEGAEIHGSASLTLEEITALMVGAARQGKVVARVHSGDPSLFGALLEQMVALEKHGIEYAIVPGVSSLFAAAASLGAELTVPGLSQTVIVTRMEGRTPVPEGEKLRELARHQATLALFLSAALVEEAVPELLVGGYPPDTPAALVHKASWEDEQILRGTLADIAAKTRAAGIRHQALILVGQALDPQLPKRGPYRSKLYDARFSHRYRQAQGDVRSGNWGETPVSFGEGHPTTPSAQIAIVALTKHGALWGAKLREGLKSSELFVSAKFRRLAGQPARAFEGPVQGLLGEVFHKYRGLVLFLSLGAAVRMLAKHLKDKKSDPGVVVVDDRAQYAVAVLSGHRGGANALARQVAALLGGTPVITTASDVGGTLAVDLLGERFGWEIEDGSDVTGVSAAMVNEEPVGVFQDAGERDWWPEDRPLPPNIEPYSSLDALAASQCAALIITDRLLGAAHSDLRERAVVYRPKSLAVGLGCHRGTSAQEIEAAVRRVLEENGLSFQSIRTLATIDAKRDEKGLLSFAAQYGLLIQYFRKDELNAADAPSPSPAPWKHMGARGVAEPAALLAAKTDKVLVPKVKSGNVTVAVARTSPEGQRPC